LNAAGRKAHLLWALTRFLAFASATPAETLTWQDCLALAREKNPEILAARKSVQASVFSLRGSRGAYLPRLSGTLSYGRSEAETSTTKSSGSQYSAKLTASQNLFAGLADSAKVEQAEAALATSEATLRETNANVSYELVQAFARLSYAQEFTKLSDQIVKRREDNLSLVQLRYENGSENKGSLLLSQANLSQAKLDALNARNTLLTARTALAKVIGADDTADITVAGQVPVSEPPQSPSFTDLAREIPDYKRSLAAEKSAGAAVTVARAGFLPTLDLNAERERRGPSSFRGTDEWKFGIGVTVQLFNGGRDYYATKSATESLAVATLTAENKLRDAVARLSLAHATYLEAVEREKVDNGFSEAASTRAMIARQKYNNGLISFEDWDGIENDLINRQKNLVQSQRDRVTAEAAWQQAQGNGAL
jgi:outer membrane protein TolC